MIYKKVKSINLKNSHCCYCCSAAKSWWILCDPTDCRVRLLCRSLSPWVCSNSCPLSQWCHPTILSSVIPSTSCSLSFPASGSLPIRWPKYWSFSISLSDENSGLSSFRTDSSLAVQGTLKSLLQHHRCKASIHHSAFFMVQLSHLYMTIGKTTASTIWTFVGKVMSLLFDVLSQRVRHDWATELN